MFSMVLNSQPLGGFPKSIAISVFFKPYIKLISAAGAPQQCLLTFQADLQKVQEAVDEQTGYCQEMDHAVAENVCQNETMYETCSVVYRCCGCDANAIGYYSSSG